MVAVCELYVPSPQYTNQLLIQKRIYSVTLRMEYDDVYIAYAYPLWAAWYNTRVLEATRWLGLACSPVYNDGGVPSKPTETRDDGASRTGSDDHGPATIPSLRKKERQVIKYRAAHFSQPIYSYTSRICSASAGSAALRHVSHCRRI